MQQFQSEFLQKMQSRGFVNQITHPEPLDHIFTKEKITAYIGFDCTAKSLHVGSLIQIMVLQILQQCGHQPIILLGGGTTKIGDPSGKDEARKFLDENAIKENLAGIKKTLSKFDLSIENPNLPNFKFVNNDEWLQNLKYVDFLRDIGRHFSINKMLTFDSVKLRLERQQPLSFLEFNYMILQAYDFYELNQNHNCILQIGGSDQWGNIVNGVDLTRKIAAKKEKTTDVFGLTTPLLINADGKKMGKTANGAVWLDDKMLSSFDYFQYFRNVTDDDVARFLRFFTHFEESIISKIAKLDINKQKEILAFEATKICHGQDKAENSLNQAQAIFTNLNSSSIAVSKSLPEKTNHFNSKEKQNGKKLVNILREIELCQSLGEAKRLIKGGGIKINDEKVLDENIVIDFDNDKIFKDQGTSKDIRGFKIALGKKRFFWISILG